MLAATASPSRAAWARSAESRPVTACRTALSESRTTLFEGSGPLRAATIRTRPAIAPSENQSSRSPNGSGLAGRPHRTTNTAAVAKPRMPPARPAARANAHPLTHKSVTTTTAHS